MFQVYYGDGNAMHTPWGLDLSQFKSRNVGIDKPFERSFGSIQKSLERGFGVNPETHVLSVQVVVNWEVEDEKWDLMVIKSTADWRQYIDAATERGWPLGMVIKLHKRAQLARAQDEDEDIPTQYMEAEKPDRAEDHVSEMEPQGVADEGERITRIVEEVEAEDHEAQQMEECVDSSDDEAYPVPTQWREQGFGNPVIQDGRCQEWEYRENEVVQGAKYKSIEALKDAVKNWAVSLRREFRVVKSGSKEYEVKCLKDGCP